MKTIERAFAVLRALAEHDESAGVSEVARRTGLPKSTTSRILASLEGLGMVERLDDRFAIGPGLATLTHDATPVSSLRDIARPYLAELAEWAEEGVALAVPDGDEIVYVDTVQVVAVVQVQDWTGLRFPAHTTAAGLVLMAQWPDAEIDRYGRQPLTAFTEATIKTGAELVTRLAKVRQEGVAWTVAEFSGELNGVAAVIRDATQHPVGAINISGPTFRFPTPGDKAAVEAQLRATATQISERL